MRAAWLSLALLVSCHKESSMAPGGPTSTVEADALWKLAPDDAMVGVVVTPRALQMLEHAYGDIHALVAKLPIAAAGLQKLDAELTAKIGTAEFTFAAIGLTTQKGGAMFVGTGGKPVMIMPVADRDKLLALSNGKRGHDDIDQLDDKTKCKQTHGVYACSEDLAYLDKLGTGAAFADKLKPAKARGDIEVIVSKPPIPGAPDLEIAGAIQLERGGFTVRGRVDGVRGEIKQAFGSMSKPDTDDGHASGFGLIHAKQFMQGIVANASASLPPEAAKLMESIGDPITMIATPNGVDMHVPLDDDGPAKAVLADCTKGAMAKLAATPIEGGCHIQVPQFPIGVDVWVADKQLHYGSKGMTSDKTQELTSLGKELADTAWQIVLWGHGSALAVGIDLASKLPLPPEMQDMVGPMATAASMLNEAAIAVRVDDGVRFVFAARTAWSNPDDVVKQLIALDGTQVLSGKGPELAKPIIAGAPNSPLAKDVHAGATGLLVPMSLFGVMAAVAVPAFMDYMKKSKQSEASLELNRIAKSLKRYYAENATFPAGDAGVKDATGCCISTSPANVRNKCPVDPKQWHDDKIWSALEFEIDQPSLYQYRYHSDGQSVLVEAIGDADCDGTPAIWRLEVKLNAGTPVIDLHKPDPGQY